MKRMNILLALFFVGALHGMEQPNAQFAKSILEQHSKKNQNNESALMRRIDLIFKYLNEKRLSESEGEENEYRVSQEEVEAAEDIYFGENHGFPLNRFSQTGKKRNSC